MESHLNTATQAVRHLEAALNDYQAAQTAIRALSAYYGSDEWRQDYAADEQRRLPMDLQRGVLSEDGIWTVLEDIRVLNIRLLEVAVEIMKRA